MAVNSELTELYSGIYTDNIRRIREGSTSFLNAFRDAAFDRFTTLGIPTRKNENYKYTNLDLFFRHNYKTYFIPDESDL